MFNLETSLISLQQAIMSAAGTVGCEHCAFLLCSWHCCEILRQAIVVVDTRGRWWQRLALYALHLSAHRLVLMVVLHA